MGHYAKVINGRVQQVIVAKADFTFVAPVQAIVAPSASRRDQDYYEIVLLCN